MKLYRTRPTYKTKNPDGHNTIINLSKLISMSIKKDQLESGKSWYFLYFHLDQNDYAYELHDTKENVILSACRVLVYLNHTQYLKDMLINFTIHNKFDSSEEVISEAEVDLAIEKLTVKDQ